MNEPLDPRLHAALDAAARPGARRGAEAVMRAARAESEAGGPAVVTLAPGTGAHRPNRRLPFLAAAAALVLVVGGAATISRRPTASVATRTPDELLGYLQQSTAATRGAHTFKMRFDTSGTTTTGPLATGGSCAVLAPSAPITMAVDLDRKVIELLDDRTGEARLVTAGSDRFVNRSTLPAGVTARAPWILVADHDPRGFDLGTALVGQAWGATAAGFDPADLLDLVQRSAASVTELGDEQIDGKVTHHLRVQADPTKVATIEWEQNQRRNAPAGSVPRPTSEAVPPLDEAAKHALITFETWIGDDGLLYRVLLDRQVPIPAEGGGGSHFVRSRADLTDHGEPLPAAVPTADQTMPAGDLPAVVLAKDFTSGCQGEIPPATPPAVADEMRSFAVCESRASRASLEGLTVAQVPPGWGTGPSACAAPGVAAWCRTQTFSIGDVSRSMWCSRAGVVLQYIPPVPGPGEAPAGATVPPSKGPTP